MRSFLIHLSDLVNRAKVERFYKELLITEKLSADELKKYQYDKLIYLLNYAYKYCPFYYDYMREKGVNIADNSNVTKDPYEILKYFPVTDKLFIKNRIEQWQTQNNKARITQFSTSGSTGTPFSFNQSWINFEIKRANFCRTLSWHGVKRGEKQIAYGGIPAKRSFIMTVLFKINDYAMSRINVNSVNINQDNVINEIHRIDKELPITICGYPSTISEIAKYSIQNDVPINNPNLKAVIFSGESHTSYISDLIGKAFHMEPVDDYCSTEGYIAGSCEKNNLHLSEDTLIAEVLDENGNIKECGKGELLVTYLYSYDFPFIRYNAGDIVEISKDKCECGRSFKVLKTVDGRKNSFIYNGQTKIAEAAFLYYITITPVINYISKYQIIQNDLQRVVIKLVVTDKERDYSGFEAHMRKLFDKLVVTFEYVDDIPKDISGKFRAVINNIQ